MPTARRREGILGRALAGIASAALLTAAACGNPRAPDGGSHPPDVGWAPTPVWTAERALAWAAVGPDDVFYELGCGDGRVAVVAARRGARVVCVEIDGWPPGERLELPRFLFLRWTVPERKPP